MAKAARCGRRVKRAGGPIGLAAASALISLAACATLTGTLPQEPGLHPRLTRYAYLEEGKLVSFGVDTAAARRREDAPYVPFAVGVANIGLRELTLTRESFTLVDEEGRRYPLASIEEWRASRPFVQYDLRLSEPFAAIFAGRFSSWPRMPVVFFPSPSVGRGLARDEVTLHRHAWTLDLLYFPHPDGELVGRAFEMWLDAPELEEGVFVKFRVR